MYDTLFIMSFTKPNAAKIFAKVRQDKQISRAEADHLRSKNIKVHPSWIKKAKKLKENMSEDQKRKLLVGLRRFKEEYNGNVGGETDIANADNLVAEDEFTAAVKPERNVVAKTFDTEGDFDSYIKQRRGIEITSKEQQAVLSYAKTRPIQRDRFFIRYETTDDFGNNDTTVIKKLKEGNQFCWTAFSKHETAEEEGKPEGSEKPEVPEESPGEKSAEKDLELKEQSPSNIPSEPDPENNEVTVNDPIRITKTITFLDDTQGSDVLSDFLKKLDI